MFLLKQKKLHFTANWDANAIERVYEMELYIIYQL